MANYLGSGKMRLLIFTTEVLFLCVLLYIQSLDLGACQRCCGISLTAASSRDNNENLQGLIWTEENLVELKKFFSERTTTLDRIRQHIDQLSLASLNSEHARRIQSSFYATSQFDGGFRFNKPFVCSGTAQIMEMGTKLNIAVDNIQLLEPDPRAPGKFAPLAYGATPSNPRHAYEMVSDLLTALTRLSFEAAQYYPDLKVIVISALSVQVSRDEAGLKENRLLRLLRNKFGLEEVVDSSEKTSVKLQLRIPFPREPNDLRPVGNPPELFNSGRPTIDGRALFNEITGAKTPPKPAYK